MDNLKFKVEIDHHAIYSNEHERMLLKHAKEEVAYKIATEIVKKIEIKNKEGKMELIIDLFVFTKEELDKFIDNKIREYLIGKYQEKKHELQKD